MQCLTQIIQSSGVQLNFMLLLIPQILKANIQSSFSSNLFTSQNLSIPGVSEENLYLEHETVANNVVPLYDLHWTLQPLQPAIISLYFPCRLFTFHFLERSQFIDEINHFHVLHTPCAHHFITRSLDIL